MDTRQVEEKLAYPEYSPEGTVKRYSSPQRNLASGSFSHEEVAVSGALVSDPRYAKDFQVEDNKFAFSPGQLNKLLNPKSLPAFQALGGLKGLEYGLRTDLKNGLSLAEATLSGCVTFDEARSHTFSHRGYCLGGFFLDQYAPRNDNINSQPSCQFSDRTRIFSRNQLPEPKRKGFLRLLWDAYNDKIIILLTIAAVISLSLGVYEAVKGTSQVDWIEGVAICIAIFIVVTATAGNDYQKERQFAKLNRRVIKPSSNEHPVANVIESF